MSADTNMLNNKNLKNLDGIQNGDIWNCRSMKRPSREIKKLCKTYHPGFLFLLKIKISDYGISTIARKLGLNNFDGCPANGTTRGIALVGHDHYKFDVLIKDKSFFHYIIPGKSNFDILFVTFIQGPPYAQEKKSFWSKIENIG